MATGFNVRKLMAQMWHTPCTKKVCVKNNREFLRRCGLVMWEADRPHTGHRKLIAEGERISRSMVFTRVSASQRIPSKLGILFAHITLRRFRDLALGSFANQDLALAHLSLTY